MTRLSQVVCPGGEDRSPGPSTPLLGESGVLHLVMTVNYSGRRGGGTLLLV